MHGEKTVPTGGPLLFARSINWEDLVWDQCRWDPKALVGGGWRWQTSVFSTATQNLVVVREASSPEALAIYDRELAEYRKKFGKAEPQ